MSVRVRWVVEGQMEDETWERLYTLVDAERARSLMAYILDCEESDDIIREMQWDRMFKQYVDFRVREVRLKSRRALAA